MVKSPESRVTLPYNCLIRLPSPSAIREQDAAEESPRHSDSSNATFKTPLIMLKAAAAAKNSAVRPSLQNPRLSDVSGPLAAASDFGNNPSVLTKFGNNGHASVGWAFLPSSHLSPSPSPLPSSPFYHNQTFTLAAVAGSGKAQVHRPLARSLARSSPPPCVY